MGVALTNLTREAGGGQMSLFREEEHQNRERDQKLDKTVDALRNRFGSGIIQRGTVAAHGIDVAIKFKRKTDAGQ